MLRRFLSFAAAIAAFGVTAALAYTPVPVVTSYFKTDFNGDGRSDILWINTATNDAAIWLMNGTTPTPMVVTGAPPNIGAPVAAIDSFGAGFSQILWRNASGNYQLTALNGA